LGELFVKFERELRISAETASVHRLLGPADVAKWLGVSSGWVRDHATRKEPRLKAVKVGKLLRFRPEDVEAFLGECTERDLTGDVAG
jgi:excisionase family DNA binding protein